MSSELPHKTQSFRGLNIAGSARVHVGNNYHPSPSRLETPPSPLSTVPFRRDLDYVHRGSLLDEIHEKLSVPAARVALVGLGGVGKSQLAIEYAHQVRERSPATWVLWIHASSAARFELSVRDALDQLKVPGRCESTANVYKLFRGWLREPNRGKWLLIIDNADDGRFLSQPPSSGGGTDSQIQSERRLDYLPQSDHGSMLITSRSSDAALKLVDDESIVLVKPMEAGEAVTLMERKIGRPCHREDMDELARTLDCMPLAMAQAAAYIKQRGARCSVKQYVEKLRKSDKSMLYTLGQDVGDLRRDREATNSIISTWQISFEHVQEIKPSAADLLSLMSFFDRQGIPEALLRDRGEPQPVKKDVSSTD